jgi:hypothetical protein
VNSKIYNRALVLFLLLNSLVWIPWGIICLFIPEAWSGQVIPGMTVFDLSQAVARTEVRAMYGGLQIAIGLLALIAIFKPRHQETALLFYVMALTGLALSRMYGLVLEGDKEIIAFGLNVTGDNYNQVGLGMYEFPNFLFAWTLFLTKSKLIKSG